MNKIFNRILPLTLLTIFLFGVDALAQNELYDSVKAETNSDALLEISRKAERRRMKTELYAQQNGIPLEYMEGDKLYILTGLNRNKTPVYMELFGRVQTAGISANNVNQGGYKNLELNGASVLLYTGIWDSNRASSVHPDLAGRITAGDTNTPNFFSTHGTQAAGCIMASGTGDDRARGVAPALELETYTAGNYISETALAANNGMILSNHSHGSTPTPGLLAESIAESLIDMDDIIFNSPFYMPVFSLGNTEFSGYIAMPAGGKNAIGVSNCRQMPFGYENTSSARIHPSSSFGPVLNNTDLGFRIKPDLSATGQAWTTTVNQNNQSGYRAVNGTSFSAPVVTGGLALIQEHNQNVNGAFLHNAELKVLACHTADDGGLPGPDPYLGFGVLNVTDAVEFIDNVGCGNFNLIYETLTEGETHVIPLTLTGDSFKATLSWMDPVTPFSDDWNSVQWTKQAVELNNDLDIKLVRISDQAVFHPYLLDPTDPLHNPAITGENDVDNVLQVFAPNLNHIQPTEYQLVISHEGNLQNGEQNFALAYGHSEIVSVGMNVSNSNNFIETSHSSSDRITSVSWSGPNGFTSNNGNIYNLQSGEYILTINTIDGCQFSKLFNLSCVRPQCFGDMDGNGVLTSTDLTAILGLYGSECFDTTGCYNCAASVDGDVVIDAFDLSSFIDNYGLNCSNVTIEPWHRSLDSDQPNFEFVDPNNIQELGYTYTANSIDYSLDLKENENRNSQWILCDANFNILQDLKGHSISMSKYFGQNSKLLHITYTDFRNRDSQLRIFNLSDFSEYQLFKIYPIPSNQNIKIETYEQPIGHIEVFSLNGNLILKERVNGEVSKQLDISYLSKGIYFLKVYTNDGNSQIKQFIRN